MLRKILLHSTQAAKRESLTDDPSSTTPGVPTKNAAPKGTYSKKKGRSRPTPAYLSIHTTETKMVRYHVWRMVVDWCFMMDLLFHVGIVIQSYMYNAHPFISTLLCLPVFAYNSGCQ